MRGVVNAHLHTAAWINEYPEITKEGLGKLRSTQAEVELKVGANHSSARADQYHFHCEKRWKKHCGNKSKKESWNQWIEVSGHHQS